MVVLKYDAVHGSGVDESDCGVIFGAEEGQYFWWRNFLIAVSLRAQQCIYQRDALQQDGFVGCKHTRPVILIVAPGEKIG